MKRHHIDQILAGKREQQRRTQCALDAVLALDPDNRQNVLIQLIEFEERGTPAAGVAEEAPPAAGSFIDRAAAYIKAHPEGSNRKAIMKAIKQTPASIGKTFAALVARNEIERRGKLWFPKNIAPAKADSEPARTLREDVMALFESTSESFSVDSIHARLQVTRSALRKPAILDMLDALEAAGILLAESVDGKPAYRLQRPEAT